MIFNSQFNSSLYLFASVLRAREEVNKIPFFGFGSANGGEVFEEECEFDWGGGVVWVVLGLVAIVSKESFIALNISRLLSEFSLNCFISWFEVLLKI